MNECSWIRSLDYVFPKVFNVKGRSFSLAERIAAGRASFRRNGFGTVLRTEIATYFHPWERECDSVDEGHPTFFRIVQ